MALTPLTPEEIAANRVNTDRFVRLDRRFAEFTISKAHPDCVTCDDTALDALNQPQAHGMPPWSTAVSYDSRRQHEITVAPLWNPAVNDNLMRLRMLAESEDVTVDADADAREVGRAIVDDRLTRIG